MSMHTARVLTSLGLTSFTAGMMLGTWYSTNFDTILGIVILMMMVPLYIFCLLAIWMEFV